jgi:hypothetical protein
VVGHNGHSRQLDTPVGSGLQTRVALPYRQGGGSPGGKPGPISLFCLNTRYPLGERAEGEPLPRTPRPFRPGRAH